MVGKRNGGWGRCCDRNVVTLGELYGHSRINHEIRAILVRSIVGRGVRFGRESRVERDRVSVSRDIRQVSRRIVCRRVSRGKTAGGRYVRYLSTPIKSAADDREFVKSVIKERENRDRERAK